MIMSKSQETNWKMKGAIGKEEKRGEKRRKDEQWWTHDGAKSRWCGG